MDSHPEVVMDCPGCCVTIFDVPTIAEDQDVLVTFLTCHGIFPESKMCDGCGKECPLSLRSLTFRCHRGVTVRGKRGAKRVKCGFGSPLRKNTIFGESKLPLGVIFKFISLWLFLPHPRTAFIEASLGLAKQTITDWSCFCREVCVQALRKKDEVLGGVGSVVEVEESRLGEDEEAIWVFGGIERGTMKTFFVPIEDRNQETLLGVLRRFVIKGTTLVTDKSSCCADWLEEENGFVSQVGYQGETANIRRAWREVRAGIPRFGRRRDHLNGYLAELYWKQLHQDPTTRVHHFLQEAADLFPVGDSPLFLPNGDPLPSETFPSPGEDEVSPFEESMRVEEESITVRVKEEEIKKEEIKEEPNEFQYYF